MQVNFYNTGGWYYNSSWDTSTDAANHYYASKGRAWKMKITAVQMAQIVAEVKSATVRMYNQQTYNSTFTFYAVASKSEDVDTAFTDGNFFGKTADQSIVLYPEGSEFNLDVTSCFQYAQEKWPAQTWYLWFYWTAGSSSGTALVGYNNDSHDASYCPYFTVECGNADALTPYVFTTDRREYTYPEAAMTSSNTQGCVVTYDSRYSSSYPEWRAFDKSVESVPWASGASSSATEHWIQLEMPQALYDITVTIQNRNDRSDATNGAIAGTIYGSNDSGTTLTLLKTYEGRDGATAGYENSYELNNGTAYSAIRVQATSWNQAGGRYLAIGEIEITGYDCPATGGWRESVAYVYADGEWKESTVNLFYDAE